MDENTPTTKLPPFKEWLFKDRGNKVILLLAGAAIIIQFIIYKYFYPYASFLHGDSFVYIRAAALNSDIDLYMVGYSKFLRLFSALTNSDTALVACQYLIIQLSALFFLFSLFYFYKPGKVVQIILVAFMVLNPLFLNLANMVSSDGYFLAISLIWFTILLWIIHWPTLKLIAWHTLILFIAFTVRYNALIYPVISAIVFILSGYHIFKKVTGIAVGFLLCALFILHTGNKYKALTGTWQYSPFSGWQLANNAMYTYRYVDSAERKPVPERFKELDNSIRVYFDSSRDLFRNPQEEQMASTFYMWHPALPLQKFMKLQFKKDTSAGEVKEWASMGPLYKEYGIYVIRQYPWHYLKYFLWPNTLKYYTPPVEYLEMYNTGKKTVAPVAQEWFGYKNSELITRTKDLNVNILDFYPILTGIMNVVFLCGLLCFSLLNGFGNNTRLRNGVLLAGTIWLFNAVFIIISTAAALRFMAFPILLMFSFSLLLIDWMWKMAVNEEIKSSKLNNQIKKNALAG